MGARSFYPAISAAENERNLRTKSSSKGPYTLVTGGDLCGALRTLYTHGYGEHAACERARNTRPEGQVGAERGREELNLWGPKWRHQQRESLFSCAYANHSRATCDLLRLRMLAREKVADLPRNFDYLHNLWGVETVVRA